MDPRDQLRALLVERSFRRGDFTLASGRRSTYYIDARRTTMCAEGQRLTGHLGLQALRSANLAPSHVGGLTMGADPVSYAIAHASALDGTPIDAFSVRKKAKDHGTGRRIEGADLDGASVVVIEDSVTSGGSALQALDVLEEAGAEILAVLAVVDREEGGREAIEARGVPFLTLYTAQDLLDEDS